MTDYTPTTHDVRERYRYFDGGPSPEDGPEFDRWLEEHDRQVAAAAYEKGWDDGYKEGEGYEIAEY